MLGAFFFGAPAVLAAPRCGPVLALDCGLCRVKSMRKPVGLRFAPFRAVMGSRTLCVGAGPFGRFMASFKLEGVDRVDRRPRPLRSKTRRDAISEDAEDAGGGSAAEMAHDSLKSTYCSVIANGWMMRVAACHFGTGFTT